jgi:hypothetical protein
MAPYFIADFSTNSNGNLEASYVKNSSDERTENISEAKIFESKQDADRHVIERDSESQVVFFRAK